MTTIAWDGYDLASDSQATAGTKKMVGVQKIFRIEGSLEHPGVAYVGISGSMSKFKPVMDWLNGGPKPKARISEDVDAILIEEDGRVMMLGADENGLIWYDWRYPAAIGSGGDIALGAMLYGATAKKAVELTEMADAYSGGPIEVINIKPRPERKNRTKK